MLDPAELGWLADAGIALFVSQLDMIAFSNPSYHPSPALFHAVRNLQRHVMRIADGVTFISDFGMQTRRSRSAPTSITRRLFVVSCGVDSEPCQPGPSGVSGPFVLCLAATFWHKNRQHALRVFERLCGHHGYDGKLVIVGPSRSTADPPRPSTECCTTCGQTWQPACNASARSMRRRSAALLRQARARAVPVHRRRFRSGAVRGRRVGTPTLAYGASGLAEILDDTPSLMSTWDVDAWAEHAHALISDQRCSNDALDAVRRAARVHTWRRVAVHTWDAIDATVAAPAANRNSRRAASHPGWDRRGRRSLQECARPIWPIAWWPASDGASTT